MSVHEEYTELIEKRYARPSKDDYEQYGYYDWVLHAPYQYKTEASMLGYVKAHPNATLRELFVYFDKITPDGLAPDDDGADLMDD
jgi:hypothetical protein